MAATPYQKATTPPDVRGFPIRYFLEPSLPPSITSFHPFLPSLLPKCSLPATRPYSLPLPPGPRPRGFDPADLYHGRHSTGRGPERGLVALGRGLPHLLRWQGLLLPPSHAPDGRKRYSRPALSKCVRQSGHSWFAGFFLPPLLSPLLQFTALAIFIVSIKIHIVLCYAFLSPALSFLIQESLFISPCSCPPSMAFSFKLTFTDTYQRFPFFSLLPVRAILNLSYVSLSRTPGWRRKLK